MAENNQVAANNARTATAAYFAEGLIETANAWPLKDYRILYAGRSDGYLEAAECIVQRAFSESPESSSPALVGTRVIMIYLHQIAVAAGRAQLSVKQTSELALQPRSFASLSRLAGMTPTLNRIMESKYIFNDGGYARPGSLDISTGAAIFVGYKEGKQQALKYANIADAIERQHAKRLGRTVGCLMHSEGQLKPIYEAMVGAAARDPRLFAATLT